MVWSSAPVSRMASGTLNMSTMVVLQNRPAELYVNSAQSCSTPKFGSEETQPAGYCSAAAPLPSATALNFSFLPSAT